MVYFIQIMNVYRRGVGYCVECPGMFQTPIRSYTNLSISRCVNSTIGIRTMKPVAHGSHKENLKDAEASMYCECVRSIFPQLYTL